MNRFGSDGEAAPSTKRNPGCSDRRLKRRHDDGAEMMPEEPRKSRGKRDRERGRENLLKDTGCSKDHPGCHDSPLVVSPSKRDSKGGVGHVRSSGRVGCVGYNGHDISRNSNVLSRLLSWLRKRRKSKKGDTSELDMMRKADLDKRWSAFSLEDKYYAKSQLSIWFPCIFRHPTLSELEAALALMGNRILDKVSRFQIIDLNPNLTLSRAARNHFRSCHKKCERDEFDGELIGALICERKSSTASSDRTRPIRFPPDHSFGSLKSDKILSQLTLITSRIDGLSTNASSNSFLHAERNWRHCAMAGRAEPPAEVSPAQSEGDVSELSAARLEEMYDRKKYHVPDWFYLLVQNGRAIELLPANTGDLEITSGEVKDIVESSRRISLHVVPNCVSSDDSGHILVSITEQERRCPARTVPRKVPPLRGICRRDSSRSSSVGVGPSPTCSWPAIDGASNKMESESRNDHSFEELFPQDRVLSFRHNWALVDQSIYNQRGLIRLRKKKGHKKLDPLPKTGRIGKSEVNPSNTNVSGNTGSHPFRGTFPKRLESVGGKEKVNSANVKKCRQHKQMISRILTLMKERSLADKSSGGGDESHKPVDSPVASDIITDKSSIMDTYDCRRRHKSKLTRCQKNVRFADTIKQRDRVTSPGNRTRTEVNKSNSAIDDVDKLGETSGSFFGNPQTKLDKHYSSLHGEYSGPERYRGYDVDYLTRSIEMNKVSEVDQNHDVCNSSIFWADSDPTNLRRLRKPDFCDPSRLDLRADESANCILGEELARLINIQCTRKTHKRVDKKTCKLCNLDRLGEMNTNDEHYETGEDMMGIPKAVHLSSSTCSSTTSGSNVGVNQCRRCGKQAFRDYARGTFAKFVKEQWHSEGTCEPLRAPKLRSGHKLQPAISSNQPKKAKAGKYPPELSPFPREKRPSCSKARPDARKTKRTEGTLELVELQQKDYEIACANRRLGYNYICTIVDDYYKSFVSGDDETAEGDRKSYRDSATSRRIDAKSKHAGQCSSYKTGGVRKMVVKSTATPDDNKSLALLIDRYLAADDQNVVDISKPLKDLDSLLEYCSRLTSADCLLGDSTLNILRAINDIITRFITIEDEKLTLRVEDDFGEGMTTAGKNQKSRSLLALWRPYNVPCRKVTDVATQTYSKSIHDCGIASFACCRCGLPKDWAEHSIKAKHCSEHAADPFQSCETCESTRSASHHLDETQNKLDSETDYPSAGRILTSDEPAGEAGAVAAPESGRSAAHARLLSGELERLLTHARRQSAEVSDEYSDTLMYPAQKSPALHSRKSPERLEPAFFSSQRLASVGSMVDGPGASTAQDRGAFPRARRDPTPLEIIITPASPPNLSDNHGSLASNENGTAFPKQAEDVLSRYYSGLISGTDKLRPPSAFPETAQEHAFRYGEQRRPSYHDGAISQNLRPEKSVRMKDDNYILPDRESAGVQTSKVFNLESAFSPNIRLSFERSPKQTESFAAQTDPNVSCNRTNCHLQVCPGDCLRQACPARCLSHPFTSSCSPCASALPRNLECHCKPEVTMRSCMTPPPWRPRYRLCKNAFDDNLGPYLCPRSRISDFPSSFLNFRPSLNVTPNARFCHRTMNDIFCDLKRENTSPDCFANYRRKPAHDCAHFFERKLTDKFPSCSMRNCRHLNMPTFESAPATPRRCLLQSSEPPMQVSDPNSASDIQQQTLALIGQVLNTLQANRKPPDVEMTDKPCTSPSSDGGSCSKPCKERRPAANPRKKCKRVKSECTCKSREKDPPSDQSSQRDQVDAKSRNPEVDFIEEISEQSLPRTRMCTKSLQVNVDACGRKPAQTSPARRASCRNVGMASVQTCACISKPSGECQCGCLSEKLAITQRKCFCAEQLLIDLPVETSGCPCRVKKHACLVNRCPKQESPPCGQKCLTECNKDKSVQTTVVCQKVSCNKKCQIGKLSPVTCVSTDVCGSTRCNEPSSNECGKASATLKWDQPLKHSRSSEMCGDSDVSDCTSTVHRFPTGQRFTGHGLCQRKCPKINFQIPSRNYCEKVRPCLQNLCGNIPLRSREYSISKSPCFPVCREDRKTYQHNYCGNIKSCRQRRSDKVTRSFQSLLDDNSTPVKAASSAINRDSRTEELYNLPDCGCVQEKYNRLKSCNSCGARRDTSPRKFSFTPADASNVRKTAWCECDAPKEDAGVNTCETSSKAVGADATSLNSVEKEAEKCRPFVQIKYKSKRVVSDKPGDARQAQPCSANGVKGLAEQLKEQIDEIICRSRDLQQQAIQFNVGSSRCYVDTGVDSRLTGCDNRPTGCDNRPTGFDYRLTGCDNRITGCDNRLTGCDNRPTGCDNRPTGCDNRPTGLDYRLTGCDNRLTGCDYRLTGCDNRLTGCDYRLTGYDNRAMASDNRGTTSDNRGTASDNRGTASDNRGTATDNRGTASDNRGTASDNRGTASDYHFPGFDSNATGSDHRATGPSYDARAKNSHAFPTFDARSVNGGAASVVGSEFRISKAPSSPRSEIKIRNSQVASSSLLGAKISGTLPPQNSIVEVIDPESLHIGQVRPSDLAVLADLKMTSGASASLVKDGSYRPVEGESTVIDMGTRGSQDVIRFQTEREGNEGWSFYEVEVNDPKSPREIKKTESSPNKNFNSNKTGSKADVQDVKQFEPKLCASDNFNIFSDAFKRFQERMKCLISRLCPACKKTYTIVPGFRPIVLGHCTNLNVSWNASSGDDAQERRPTGRASRDASGKSVETFSDQQPVSHGDDGVPPSFTDARAIGNRNSIRPQAPTRGGYRNNNSGRTVHVTPEGLQGAENRANSQRHGDAPALKEKGVSAKVEDVKPGGGADGDGLVTRRIADSAGNIALNAHGDIATRTTRLRQFQERCNLANHNGPNLAHHHLKISPLVRNKNLNSVEYHEISCEEHVSSSNDHPNDTNDRMVNQVKLLHCKMSSIHSKGEQNCGRYSKHTRFDPVNNGREDIKSDQSKTHYPKQQSVLYTAVGDMGSQCEHDVKDQNMPMKGMAVKNYAEDRLCLANSQHILKNKLRNTYAHKAAAKCVATQRLDKGMTATHQPKLRKTTIIEDLSNSRSTTELSTSYECQHGHHDSGNSKTSQSMSDPLRSRSRIVTGIANGTGSSKQLQRSYRTHANRHDKIPPRCFDVETDIAVAETMLTKHEKTSSSSRIMKSVLENDVLLVQQAKPGIHHRTVVVEKFKKLVVEDNSETSSTTHTAPRGKMVSGNTRPSQSADSAASSHGIEDLPTDSWVNVNAGPCQESSTADRPRTVYPYVEALNNCASEQKELIQRVWRGDTSGAGSEHSTVISDDRVVTARPWRECVSLEKRVRNIGVQIDEKFNDPSVYGTRNTSSVVSQNYTITPRRRSVQRNSDQTDFDVSTSGQFDDTLTSSECTTQFSRPWFPKDELVKWWNSTKSQHEGDQDTKDLHLVSSDSRGDMNSYHDRSAKHRIMTDPRIVASILGTNVTRRNCPSWVECKDSATLTDDIMNYLHAQNMQSSMETYEMSAGVTSRLSDAGTESAHALQKSSGAVSSRPGSSVHPHDVSQRGHPGAQHGDGSWRNAFVTCGELTEASDERVLLEGAFYAPWCADRGEPCDGVSRSARSAPGSLPFRLVLFARADGEMGTKIYGTFLRRLSQSDRSFKWKVKMSLPCKSDHGILLVSSDEKQRFLKT